MARVPGWVRVSKVQSGEGALTFEVRLRVWHPGFWRHVIQEIRQHVDLEITWRQHTWPVPWIVVVPVLLPWAIWHLRRPTSHTTEVR